jgi:ornithine cyclodeaminase/alanine dehydrogenase-like protein (mu-crystallin family)
MKGIEITVLSERDIATVAPARADIVRIIERTYRAAAAGRAEVPAKIGVHPDFPASFCHAMPAWVEAERALGMKWITYYPGNAARGLADSTGIIVLNDADSGMPVAVMEGMWITYARTSACAAVAARHLARPGATRLGLIGCGGLGTWSLRMLAEAYPEITEVRVSSRSSESREAFCRAMAAEVKWRLIPARSNEEVVRESDIVISSISKSDTPQALAAWWPAGSLAIPLDVTGCWDSAAFARADRLVSDGYESLVRAASRNRPDLRLSEAGHVRLEDVVAGRVAGRLSANDRIMAVPTGVASVDMTLAWEIFRGARKAGLGQQVRLT